MRTPQGRVVQLTNKIALVSGRLVQALGREPDIEEIAEETGVTPGTLREVLKISEEPISLNNLMGDDDDTQLGHLIEDTSAPAPLEATSLALFRTQVEDILESLTPRERRVLHLRFGFIKDQERTVEEIAKRFGVARERIRHIEVSALRKLRDPSRSQRLIDFFEP